MEETLLPGWIIGLLSSQTDVRDIFVTSRLAYGTFPCLGEGGAAAPEHTHTQGQDLHPHKKGCPCASVSRARKG